MKTADIDINPFGDHDKMDHSLMKQAKLFLSAQEE